jgi:hypothetical protein
VWRATLAGERAELAHAQFIARKTADAGRNQGADDRAARQLLSLPAGDAVLDHDRAILAFYLFTGAHYHRMSAEGVRLSHQDEDGATCD